MTTTATFPTNDTADFVAAIAGHADNTTVTFTTTDLDRLATLPEDNDGHYDGTHIWVGGTEYAVVKPLTVKIDESPGDFDTDASEGTAPVVKA